MEILFYIAAAIAIFSTLRVVTNTNPIHALLNLIVSLLSVAVIFFMLGAPFAGALEVIVYAGAIMVLFVFVVMMLNLGSLVVAQEKAWLTPKTWIGPGILSLLLLIELCRSIGMETDHPLNTAVISPKAVGISLFGPYVLAVELASMLLLSAMVTAWHLGRDAEKE